MPRPIAQYALAALLVASPVAAQQTPDVIAPPATAPEVVPETAPAAAASQASETPATTSSAPSTAAAEEEIETVAEVQEVKQVGNLPPWDAAVWSDRNRYPYIERGVNFYTARTVKQNALLLIFDHRVNQAMIARPIDDFFGLDAGALKIGLGARYGILDNLDVGIYRLNGTQELFDVYELDLRYRPIKQEQLMVDAAIRAGGTLFWQPGHLPAGGGYAQLVVDREFFDRVLIAGNVMAHSNSSNPGKRQRDTDWSVAAGALLEVRLLSFLAWDLEAAVPFAGYKARYPSWSTALKFITNQHTFALVASNTQYISADGLVTGSDRGPAETILGFTIARQIAF